VKRSFGGQRGVRCPVVFEGGAMRILVALAMSGAAGLALAAPRGKEAPPKAPPLVGTWELAEMNGRPVPATARETMTFTPDGKVVEQAAGKAPEPAFEYVTDRTTEPARFDYVFRDPKRRKMLKPIEGIYKVEGDKLTICYAVGLDSPRPAEFKYVPSETSLFVYMRVKSKD
jgi:uncharacterized protein (TIGR03067 family)